MNLMDILSDLESSEEYQIITSWKEIPIRTKLSLKWVSPQDRLVSFDFTACKFRQVFSDTNPVYLKIEELFLLCRVFSNIRDELILEVETPVPAPPIVLREFIRVEPTQEEPVFVSFCVEGKCITKVMATDISESGVGVIINSEESGKLMELLSQIATDARRVHTPFEIEIELPKEGKVQARGELKNIIGKQEGPYIRLGFRLTVGENGTKRIRQYIMRRQRDILEQLKTL